MKQLTFIFAIPLLLFNSCSTTKNAVAKDELSPDKILFTSKRDGNFEVYVMNSDSSNVQRLTNDPKTDYGQNWSSDGKYILFYSDRTGNDEIWRMGNDGSNPINLTNAPSNERNASFSPDGNTIVFTSDRDSKTIDLYIMNPDGSNVRRLTNNKMYCESPIWTKDGNQIIYTLQIQKDPDDENFNGELVIIDKNGKNQQRLTNRDGFDSGAAISPDGKKIAFYGRSEKGFMDIFLMDIDGRNVLNLTENEIEDYSPSWSPDGNCISFTSGNSTNYDIWKMNINTKEKIRLTTHPKRDETPIYKPKSE